MPQRSLSITLGTGFGSAFINESVPVPSGESVPKNGCVWHLPFENGIADDYFSTRGLVYRYKQKTGKNVKGAKEIAVAAAQNDEIAVDLFIDFGSKLVDLLKSWIRIFGVETLVIGGNISLASDWFLPALRNALEQETLSVKVEISELKETAAIIGSARLIEPEYWAKVKDIVKEM